MDAETWKAILSTLATIIGALLVAAPGIYALIQQRRKNKADTFETMQDTLDKAVTLNKNLQIRIEGVEERTVILLAEITKKGRQIDELERINKLVIAENRRLEKYVKMLIDEIRRCGGVVPPMPDIVLDIDVNQT